VGDAGLRFLTYEAAAELMHESQVLRCQVITLGTVPWAAQQKTRTAMATVDTNLSSGCTLAKEHDSHIEEISKVII